MNANPLAKSASKDNDGDGHDSGYDSQVDNRESTTLS